MTERDRCHWDAHYAESGVAPVGYANPPSIFAAFADLFPTGGRALEIACGRGCAALWLACRGMEVHAVDVSSTAIQLARELHSRSADARRARFEVFDLDNGLPDGPPVELLLCHNFRDERLYQSMMDRLAPRGLLAIATLSEVDAGLGSFRARRGELRHAFRDLELLAEGESDGKAWLVGRQR